MKYLVIDDKKIVINIISANDSFAKSSGAVPYYDGAAIGQPYDPPEVPSLEERVAMLENELSRIKNTYVNNGEHAEK